MVTVTVSMGIHKKKHRLNKIFFNSCVLTLLSCEVIFSQRANALDLRVRPYLSISEVFSDNLTLSETGKKSGFITEVSPGLSAYGSSPWSNFNLNYRLQGLYNAGGRDAVDVKHQLQMNSLYQLVRNKLFIQANSSISQQNISNTFIATDNLTGNSGRTETKNFSISPYWTPTFGQYAKGLFKVGYQNASFGNSGSVAGFVSDSQTFSAQARLSSGSKFSSVRWNLNYSLQENYRDAGDDVRFERYFGDVQYYLTRKFSVFGQFGYENNEFLTLNNTLHNGFYYTFGGRWSPSKWYSVEAGYGNNKFVTVRFNPSSNLTSYITYRNKDIGLNTGNSWDVNINYRANQAVINARYSQQTTTVQDSLIQQINFNIFDTINNTFLINPITGTPQFSINVPTFFNDVVVSKQANLTLGYRTGKSYYNISLYNTRRSYELNPQEDDVFGASASWQWQFAPRLNFYLRPTWQSTNVKNAGVSSGNDRYDVALGLSRTIPINLGRPLIMNTRLEFRHISQISDLSSSDYTENRATANFAVQF